MSKTIKQRLNEPGLIRIMGFGRMLNHTYLQVVGMQGGFHGVWFDLEHGNTSVTDLEVAALAARSQGLDNFCRIAPTDYATVTRCLEAGSSGVMAAQIYSAAQAAEFVQWTKFAPQGRRGLNNGGYDAGFGRLPLAEFCETSNRNSLVIIQIETAESVEECEQIAALDGVDMLFVGPSDLSQNLGVTGDLFHSKCVSAIERVGKACRDTGKQWGAVCASPEHAEMLISNGCKMLSPINDVKLLAAGLNTIKGNYESLFAG